MINENEIIDWGRYRDEKYSVLLNRDLHYYIESIVLGYKMKELKREIQEFFLYVYQRNLNFGYRIKIPPW